MARKTQRRRRSRRQRGGVPRWQILLGALPALASLPKTEAQSFGEVVSAWWNEGGWKNSKNLADKLLLQDLSYPSPTVEANLTEVAKASEANSTSVDYSPPPHTDANETVVEPYLPEVRLNDLKTDGSVYKYGDIEFTLDTWSNKGDKAAISTRDGKTIDVPMNAMFKVISEPPKEIEEDDDDDYDGGRRRKSRKQRRKTLRRKK